MLIWRGISKWCDLLPAVTDSHRSSLTAANLVKCLGPWALCCPGHQQMSHVFIHPQPNPAPQAEKPLPPLLFCRPSKIWEDLMHFFPQAMRNYGSQKETLSTSKKGFTSYRKKLCLGLVFIFWCNTEGGKGRHLQGWTPEFWVLTPTLPG